VRLLLQMIIPHHRAGTPSQEAEVLVRNEKRVRPSVPPTVSSETDTNPVGENPDHSNKENRRQQDGAEPGVGKKPTCGLMGQHQH